MKQRIKEWLYWNLGWYVSWIAVAVYFGAIIYMLIDIISGQQQDCVQQSFYITTIRINAYRYFGGLLICE